MRRPSRYAPEVRQRAARLILEHENEPESQWGGIRSVAGKTGCTPETLELETTIADEAAP